MTAAVLGIYGNSKQEAMYLVYFVDADGQKLDGSSATAYASPRARGGCRPSTRSGR